MKNASCCQMCSTEMSFIRHIPLALHAKWMVDIVVMPFGLWQMKYLVLAKEDLTNQVEGRALGTRQPQLFVGFYLRRSFADMNVSGKSLRIEVN